jgi:thioredoxin-like negative regulator of GroEL
MVNFDQPGSMKDGQIADLIAEASKKHGSKVLGIVHCHIPENPDSEQTADILKLVAHKYGPQVLVVRVNILNFPEFAKTQHVTKPPEVLMLVDNMVAFKIQGLWPRFQIERKVDELIHGLRKVGKDWRPKVKGMQPVGGGAPSSP